mmetsp:Transcript_26756/g.84938  ORF Transcript_26756/g.84938 Transcript_26756/m.84938 type:complete len:215 (-) Transcript_26756:897-1541(-)
MSWYTKDREMPRMYVRLMWCSMFTSPHESRRRKPLARIHRSASCETTLKKGSNSMLGTARRHSHAASTLPMASLMEDIMQQADKATPSPRRTRPAPMRKSCVSSPVAGSCSALSSPCSCMKSSCWSSMYQPHSDIPPAAKGRTTDRMKVTKMRNPGHMPRRQRYRKPSTTARTTAAITAGQACLTCDKWYISASWLPSSEPPSERRTDMSVGRQ